MNPPPLHRLTGLANLALAGDRHPGYIVYTGLPAFEHDAVLEVLSSDRTEAKRLHRWCVRLGFVSPVTSTSRDRRAVRVQFLYPERIRAAFSSEATDAH